MTPTFLFGRSLPFLILYIKYFSHTILVGSNLYMDTDVRDLKVAFFKANSI